MLDSIETLDKFIDLDVPFLMDERKSRDGRGAPIYRPKYLAKNQPKKRI